ncbi:MAG: HAD hydrolase family protein [Balneolaceae bacterium]|nr:HAD hydrolase family protein [Balneolaceae bacterium]
MIQLFVTDIDGCISYPFKTPNWETINKIRELNLKSRVDENIPPLTICTGRPYPYAEAVAQWLDVRIPFVFESAGLYLWEGNKIETALESHDGALEPIRKLQQWIKKDLLPLFPTAQLEFTKMMDAGIVCPDESTVKEMHGKINEKVSADFPELEVHSTDVSVNILMPGNNKLQGMKLLAEKIGVELNEIAYIGDTSGDIDALKNVKLAFSPKNAIKEVKEVTHSLDVETTDAVLEAYKQIIKLNREHSATKSAV